MSTGVERDEALKELNNKLGEWRQGDVGRPGVFVSVIRRDLPLAPSAITQAVDATDDYFLHEPDGIDGFVLVSQTCDVVKAVSDELGGRRFWVQVAPLVTLDGEEAPLARKGRAPRYAVVPGVGPDSYADLDRCTTVEKAVLVMAKRTIGCVTDKDRREFSEAVARNRGRFAFPDELDKALAPLKAHMQRRAGKNSSEGRCVDSVLQVRAESDRNWDAPGARLTIHFIVDVDHLGVTDDEYPQGERDVSEVSVLNDAADVAAKVEAASLDDVPLRQALWQRLTELWVAPCEPNAAVAEVIGMVASEAEFTVLQMRRAPQLDLDHLSPGETAID